MSYKTYEKYRDSNVEWIGEIPSHWDMIPVKHHFFSKKQVAGNLADNYERLALTLNGVIKRSKYDSEGLQPEKFETYQIVRKNSLIFKLIDLENIKTSRVGLSPYEGLVSPAYIILTSNGDILPDYAEKYFLNMWHSHIFNYLGSVGVRSNLNKEDVLNLPIIKPPLQEQKQIAFYLDKKTNEIDETIDRSKKLIDLLEEKKVVLIDQIVTKGLNPNIPMKESGFNWIGNIPEHWELKRLKFNCEINPSNRKSVSDEDLKINFLPMEKVSEEGKYDLESIAPYSSISKGYTYFEDNDVLVAKITPCFENGKSALVKNLKYGFGFGSTEFHVIRFKDNILPEFIYYLIKTYSFRTIGQAFMHGTAGQKRVGNDFIENYVMVTPPPDEQKDIVNYLDNEINKLTKAIAKINENINQLEEYKTSLIYYVVTGKVDVRGEDI